MARQLVWDGSAGFAVAESARISLMIQPPVLADAWDEIDYADGAGSVHRSGVSSDLSASEIAEVEYYLTGVSAFNAAPADQCYGVDAGGNYLGLVAASAAHSTISAPLPSGTSWLFTPDGWVQVVSLAQAQAVAAAEIDNAAGSARMRYITEVPGQQAVYIEKLTQAQAWTANPTGTPPPYVAAEAAAMATNPTAAANYIISTASAWGQQLSPAIEGARRAGKIAVAACADISSVQTAQTAALGTLNAF